MTERNDTQEIDEPTAAQTESGELSPEELDEVSGDTGIPATAANSASGSYRAGYYNSVT